MRKRQKTTSQPQDDRAAGNDSAGSTGRALTAIATPTGNNTISLMSPKLRAKPCSSSLANQDCSFPVEAHTFTHWLHKHSHNHTAHQCELGPSAHPIPLPGAWLLLPSMWVSSFSRDRPACCLLANRCVQSPTPLTHIPTLLLIPQIIPWDLSLPILHYQALCFFTHLSPTLEYSFLPVTGLILMCCACCFGCWHPDLSCTPVSASTGLDLGVLPHEKESAVSVLYRLVRAY